MKRTTIRKSLITVVMALTLVTGFIAGTMIHNGVTTTHAAGLPFQNLQEFTAYVQANHKAPFTLGNVTYSNTNAQGTIVGKNNTLKTTPYKGWETNVKVNQDLNPWPKAGVAAAVNPVNGSDYVVMSNDLRDFYSHLFFHVSSNGGQNWTDDAMSAGSDPITGLLTPLSYQTDPGVAFDNFGHSYLTGLSVNLTFDTTNGYINLDTMVGIGEGYQNGSYISQITVPLDAQPCNGTSTAFNCPAILDSPLITIDNNPTSKHFGSIYVYYTLLCLGTGTNNKGPCTDGRVTVPASSSAILVVHAPGWNQPFSQPALVSGALTQEQFSDMVIDNHGIPHIFFDDFSTSSIKIYMSTLTPGGWVVSNTPIVSFKYAGLNNINWQFSSSGSVAPGCSISEVTAYCAFSASKIGNGPEAGSPSIFLAVVDTATATTSVHRVNDDSFFGGKDHFFPWATVTPKGDVYVGWYDNRNDPFNNKVQYFVGKSTNGGKTFPEQIAVSDTSFNPCVGSPGCSFFGNYTQLVSGPNSVVHAAWSDTRAGSSMQIYTQSITW